MIHAKTSLFFSESRSWRYIFWCMVLSALMPEYIAPIMTSFSCILYLINLRVNKLRVELTNAGIFFLIFVVWQFIGIIYTPNKLLGLSISGLWLLGFFVYLYTYYFVNSFERLEKIMFAVSVTGGIAGLIGVFQIFLMHYGHYISKSLTMMFNPFWRMLNTVICDIATSHVLPDFIVNALPKTQFVNIAMRASSTFTNPLIFAYFLILLLPFAVHGFFYSNNSKRKWISFACIILIIGGIASSYSRGPYLAAAITIIILMFYNKKTAYKLIGLSFASLIILLMVAPGVFERLLTIGNSNDNSINLRYRIWEAALHVIKDHFFFGVGTSVEGMREILITQYGINQPHAHNLFLEMFIEGGIVGFGLFAAALAFSVWRIIKLCILNSHGRALGLTFLASFAGIMACGMLDHVLYGPKILVYFMFMIGLSEAAYRLCLKEIKEKSKKSGKVL